MSQRGPSPLRIFLIRHGQTEWALSGRHTGLTDMGLTRVGEREARGLATALSEHSFTKVLTSPLRRARQTCELAGQGAAAEVDADLAEWDYGDYEGLTTAEIHQQSVGWDVFADGCPHGETPMSVSSRADRVVGRLRALSGNIAVFSHGQFSRALAMRWSGMRLIHARHFALGTASISVLSLDPGHPEVPIIAMWNLPAASVSAIRDEGAAVVDKATPAPAIQRWENEGGETLHQKPGDSEHQASKGGQDADSN